MATTYSNTRFLLLDNGSSAETVETLKVWADGRSGSWRPVTGPSSEAPVERELLILFNSTNTGYAGGNNIALKCALAWDVDWVLVLNNDATIPPSYISSLISDALNSPTAGMIGSRQSYPPEYNLRPSCGVRISYNFGAYPFWKYRCGPGTRRANFAPGNSVLMRTSMLRQIGVFDDRYFLYSEDLDLSYRTLQAGWEILINRDITAIQGVSTSLGGRRSPTYYYYLVRNTLLFLSERLAGWRRWVSLSVFATLMLVKSITWLLGGRRRNVGAAVLGFQHFLNGRFGQAPSI
jgi:GT2 family glycosyltransferase